MQKKNADQRTLKAEAIQNGANRRNEVPLVGTTRRMTRCEHRKNNCARYKNNCTVSCEVIHGACAASVPFWLLFPCILSFWFISLEFVKTALSILFPLPVLIVILVSLFRFYSKAYPPCYHIPHWQLRHSHWGGALNLAGKTAKNLKMKIPVEQMVGNVFEEYHAFP